MPCMASRRSTDRGAWPGAPTDCARTPSRPSRRPCHGACFRTADIRCGSSPGTARPVASFNNMKSKFARGKAIVVGRAALACGMALSMAAPGGRLDARQPGPLRGGETVTGEVAPGQVRVYTLAAEPGVYIRILVKHGGDAVGA